MANDLADTACSFAWTYPVLSMQSNGLRHCCRSAPNTVTDRETAALGIDLFNQAQALIDRRLALLRGEKHTACSSCWYLEQRGVVSARNGLFGLAEYVASTGYFPDRTIDQIEQLLRHLTPAQQEEIARLDRTEMVEISLGNTCDLKCVYCNHHYSSQWASELLRHGDITHEDIEPTLPLADTAFEQAWWQWFEHRGSKQVSTINFIGGEPLIITRYYQYLQRILDIYSAQPPAQQLTFMVVTNLNTPRTYLQKFIDLLQRIMAVSDQISFEISISAESVGNRAAFIRTGTDWQQIDSNLEQLLQFRQGQSFANRLHISLIPSINSLCVSGLVNFYQWVLSKNQEPHRHIGLRNNQVVFPVWNNTAILPPEYADYIDEVLALIEPSLLEQPDPAPGRCWGYHLKFLRSVQHGIRNKDKDVAARREFARQIDVLTERRDLDFAETFPEMIDFYNLCKDAE